MKIEPKLRILFWETTAGCNLSCIHCRRLDVAEEMMKSDLSLGETLVFIDQIAEVGRCILVLSGGEPLIRKDIFDIAQYASWKGLSVALATNGTLIDASVAARIRESGIHRVAVSIDGADEATHDNFRKQPGSLRAALQGLDHCKKEGLSLQINCTITQHNVHQRDEIYRLAESFGTDALHFFMLVPVGCGMSIADTHMLSAEKYEEVLNWIYARWKEGKMFVKATCAPHYFRVVRQRQSRARRGGSLGEALAAARHSQLSGPPSGESADSRPPAPEAAGLSVPTGGHPGGPFSTFTRGCLAGTDICFVSHQGDVFPCGYLPVSAGNIRQKSFREIWEKSPVWEGFRNTDLLEGKCGACEFKNICLGCRARAYYDTGNFLAEEPYCIYEPISTRERVKSERAVAGSDSLRPAKRSERS